MPKSSESFLLVAIQLASFFYMSISTPFQIMGLIPFILLIGSIVIALAGVYEMRTTTFRVFPEPAKQGELVTSGIYRFIRHPLYSAMILAAIAMFLVQPEVERLMVLLILILDLLLKSHYEEFLLEEQYPSYQVYKAYTRRLIPFVY